MEHPGNDEYWGFVTVCGPEKEVPKFYADVCGFLKERGYSMVQHSLSEGKRNEMYRHKELSDVVIELNISKGDVSEIYISMENILSEIPTELFSMASEYQQRQWAEERADGAGRLEQI
ncbi:hypothetical protein GOV11_00685 [Candidatus Woesearchaeota archaeon]|nr:hypothetical protein [Candidatus Woesearchaeota archaeon]